MLTLTSLSHFISIVSFEGLQLSQDLLPVGELVQRVGVVLDLTHQEAQVLVGRGLDHLLDHVVAVLVLDHGAQRGLVLTYLGYQPTSLLTAGVTDALLHHVTGELVLGQHHHSPLQAGHYLGLVGRLPVLQDVLDDVVAVLVEDQLIRAHQQLR